MEEGRLRVEVLEQKSWRALSNSSVKNRLAFVFVFVPIAVHACTPFLTRLKNVWSLFLVYWGRMEKCSVQRSVHHMVAGRCTLFSGPCVHSCGPGHCAHVYTEQCSAFVITAYREIVLLLTPGSTAEDANAHLGLGQRVIWGRARHSEGIMVRKPWTGTDVWNRVTLNCVSIFRSGLPCRTRLMRDTLVT